MKSYYLKLIAIFIGCLLIAPRLGAQALEGESLVKASLLSNTSAIVSGQPFEVGVLLEMAPGWHTYWEYSGDAGLPIEIAWNLPAGFTAGPIQWPLPEAKLEPGEIQTYAYSNRVLLPVKITPPKDISGSITLKAVVSWLVCKDTCVPGDAKVEISLPVSDEAHPLHADLFEEFRAMIPLNTPPPFSLIWKSKAGHLELHLSGIDPGALPELFPLPRDGQAAGHPKFLPPDTFEISGTDFHGVLAIHQNKERRAWVVDSNLLASPDSAHTPGLGLWLALFYGFLGGIVLNLMPCVLPVISLKIFGFIHQAGNSRMRIFTHGLAFTAGIFTWFVGLAIVIIFLKSAGTQVTWAFQFQNPWFNVVIGTLVFVFALNLAGVFEVILPGRTATTLEKTGDAAGLGGSFFQGVFATLLATPCTAPFLGSALGFAFSQSSLVILAMFASIATGMALPYLLLTAQPGWMRFLPRPGAWMERLKQFMAFPLFATLVWILLVLGGQRGVDGIVWFCAFLLCAALSCWLYGAFQRNKLVALLAAVIFCAGAAFFLGGKFAHSGQINPDGISWVPFSKDRLKTELAAGKSVFVDFTADWCITCKFNEKTAIDTAAVRALLHKKNIVPMKADWTNANPEITETLKRFGRVGVPFYLIYVNGDASTPVVLPELLTEATLIDALEKIL